MKRHTWIPLAIGIVATYIVLDRRAARYAAEYDDLDSAADTAANWGSKQRIAGTGRSLLGRLKQGFGRITGNDSLVEEGVLDQIAGDLQNTSGKAAHGISDTVHDLRS